MQNLKINKVMTVEELLMPRYKVIADYPGMDDSYEIGEVLKPAYTGIVDAYPHLFRKLNWWEERKVEDMPDYVKWDVGIYPTWKKIMKVDKWNSNGSFDHENVTISVINCFPATEQQYNDYINSKSNAKP
jgi:hypothetical protein